MSTSWRSVPMPPYVAELPRNSAGRPVPGNISWHGADDDGSILVTSNADLGAHITCPCRPGLGTPPSGSSVRSASGSS
ncbi:hypothetical protein [Streptomyces alboflavus]|uniref:hypothetical protein n=1 Tax=Streptomyces alboflavus TaxID=67267 RepID=UPI001331B603|nr:hypothetical protein [Streptomyces alboflavus]